LDKALKPDIITNGLNHGLSTGNWGKDKFGEVIRTGVSQVLNRLTFVSALSHLRRLNTPIAKQGKLAKPRQLHNTHWGMICPAETPEGQACGLVKNLSLMSFVSVGSNMAILINVLELLGVRTISQERIITEQHCKIFVNGNWYGIFHEPEHLVAKIKGLRRSLEIPKEISVIHDIHQKEVRIFTDAGRVQRPLLIVKKNRLLI